MNKYHPKKIEEKWLNRWEEARLFYDVREKVDEEFYALVEFPYPSGKGLHLGHAFTYSLMDVLARKKRMAGKAVLYPMGYDAFGLPTENYAIKTGEHPQKVTERNTARFREQLKRLAFAYNWNREVNTTDSSYYKWTQWIFLQLFKHGLAYKKESPINWCPSCRIGLSNEEVMDGKCERCGEEVTKKNLEQWMLRITAYADRLVDDLDEVDYSDSIKAAQRNWIGRTKGVEIEYPVVDTDLTIACYTTRPDTNFGATFVVIAPEHSLMEELKAHISAENWKKIEKYIDKAKKKSELERTELSKEKTGVFTGLYCLNRLNNKKMPLYVADFVVETAGTGVVVGVPAHDQRDFDFAKKYELDIIPVIRPKNKSWDFDKAPYTETENSEVVNSQFLNGLSVSEAKEQIIDYICSQEWGRKAVNYHLRDWVFSRQHYWGEPIPMVYCPHCAAEGISWFDLDEASEYEQFGTWNLPALRSPASPDTTRLAARQEGWFPLAEQDLPLELPYVEKYEPTKTGESPLAKVEDWVEVRCPYCGRTARRETDTMPNWAGSSWYYLRYCDPDSAKKLADYEGLEKWLPVDTYLGGEEHTTLHLLYSRFWHKFLYDIGVVPGEEPYRKRRNHGVVLGEDNEKMSKSRGNVINPEDVVEKMGADTLRVYLLFMGPYSETMPWNSEGVVGVHRFLNRVWRLVQGPSADSTPEDLLKKFHRLVKKVGEDIDAMKYNTAIAAMMEFINDWRSSDSPLSEEEKGSFLKLLAPFAPFLAEELWAQLGREFSIHQQSWPKFDPELVKRESLTIPVQIDGVLRGKFLASPGMSKQEAIQKAKQVGKVKSHLTGKEVTQVIWVQDQLLNLVTE
ncbi:MAG: leucine--tRNA ligase [Patescibacteria group bacterium]